VTRVVPTLDIPAAKTLGDALRRVSYNEESIEELLGEEAWTTALEDVPVHERRLPQSPLATAIRLFFLELPVERAAAEHALGSAGVGALERTGLAQVGKHVSPKARIAPVENLLLASDRLSTNPTDDPPDYVSTYSPTARLCDLLTPRPHVERALDVGTGNGVQALLVAGHSEHVVATDVNPRALAFTELNAALSGLDNVECRRGSLFEPVDGEQFGLITCNAPFVVSPERRWTYRDGSHDGDELSARIVRESVAHLAPNGFATLMVSWLGRSEDEPDEHVVSWIAGSGCDSWILPIDEASPLEHAERWNAHLAGDGGAYGEALDRWMSYLDEPARPLSPKGPSSSTAATATTRRASAGRRARTEPPTFRSGAFDTRTSRRTRSARRTARAGRRTASRRCASEGSRARDARDWPVLGSRLRRPT
jgi:hypothetical protein